MSVLGLGERAKCGTLTCDTLNAKNPGGDPHLITGDLEVTGDLKVDGNLDFTPSATTDGFVVNAPTGGTTQAKIALKTDTGSTWSLDADSSGNTLFINNKLPGAVGEIVASFNTTACSVPADGSIAGFNLDSTTPPVAAAAVASTHTFPIKVGNVTYKLLLSNV